tara:strand:+ start:2401 stop:3075 length:675 start_codon:yes stop_codon:yes gene_type:complete
MMEVGGKPLVQHIIENQKKSKNLSRIILATTDRDEDKPLLELAEKLGVCGFAGSENDVLRRYKDAAEAFNLDVAIRVTGDNILVDVDAMDQTISLYLEENPDMASNKGKQGYPLGTGVAVFSTKLLQKLDGIAHDPDDREHVTLHVYRHQDKFRVLYLKAPEAFRNLDVRLTVDTPEDLSLMRQLYEKAKEHGEDFNLNFVAQFVKKHPEIIKINSHIKQRRFF